MIQDFLTKFQVQSKNSPDGNMDFDDGAREEEEAQDEEGTFRYAEQLVSVQHSISNLIQCQG